MTKPFREQAEKIVRVLAYEVATDDDGHSFYDSPEEEEEAAEEAIKKSLDNLTALHQQEVERIIGEDEKTVEIPDFAISRQFAEAYGKGVGAGRKALRAEMRQRAGLGGNDE